MGTPNPAGLITKKDIVVADGKYIISVLVAFIVLLDQFEQFRVV
jgi:hypothetical protein